MRGTSPSHLFREQMHMFLGHLPGIYEGNTDSVHEARVATRRLRELLALDSSESSEALRGIVEKVGQSLGKLRDLDVLEDCLEQMRAQGPAAGAAAVAEATVERRRSKAQRKLIKQLERFGLRSPRPLARLSKLQWAPRGWHRRLRSRIATHAQGLQAAIEHAGGIYFPRRSHSIRVAVKKLRYAVEVADATGTWQPPLLLKDLRRIQAALGDVHDAQVLDERLDELVPSDAVPQSGVEALRSALHARMAERYKDYLERRDRLRAACAACERFAAHRGCRGERLPPGCCLPWEPVSVIGEQRVNAEVVQVVPHLSATLAMRAIGGGRASASGSASEDTPM